MRSVDKILKRKVFTDVLGPNYILTQYQKKELGEFINSPNFSSNSLLRIRYFILYNLTDYVERYKRSLELGRGTTKEKMILHYGEIVGNKKWEEYLEKQKNSNSFEFKKEKYGWDETDFKNFNNSRAVTKTNLIQKYGSELGEEKWLKYIERQSYTNSLEYYIEKHGDLGRELWEDYNYKKGSSKRINDVIAKCNLTLDESLEKISNNIRSSKLELKFVRELEEYLDYKFKYSSYTKQFCIWDQKSNKAYFYDICDTKFNIIIEFNGNLWHANPKIYKKDDIIPIINLKSEDVWRRDKIKKDAAIARGFDIIHIWEKDLLENKEKTFEDIRNCLKQKGLQ